MTSTMDGEAATRRDFLTLSALATISAGSCFQLLRSHAAELERQGMSCILLWMQGGPSQFETFDPKPEHENGGPTKTISTAVPGIHVAEHWPRVAEAMRDICLIRSMTNREGNHQRATYQLQTGYVPSPSVKYPTLGSVVSRELAPADLDLPSYVRLGGGRGRGPGAGILGVEHEPFALPAAGRPPENVKPLVAPGRLERRLGLRRDLEGVSEGRGARARRAKEQGALYQRAARLAVSPRLEVFDLEKESESMRAAYGDHAFGRNCLLARRLVESGVTFVEVRSGGWDTHAENFDRVAQLAPNVDQGFAQLVSDLRRRGRLEKTLIIWMGEFGRTPRINGRGGRDHFPRASTVALAGGGVRGGQVIGKTSPDGMGVVERPVSVEDLFCTLCHGLTIDPRKETDSPLGRPVKIVDGGEPLVDVFA